MFSLRPVLNASLGHLVFFVPSASVIVAQQQDDTGFSSLLMTNYNALREEEKGFYV